MVERFKLPTFEEMDRLIALVRENIDYVIMRKHELGKEYMPSIDMSDEDVATFAKYIEIINKEEGSSLITVVIRCWNKSIEELERVYQNVLEMKKAVDTENSKRRKHGEKNLPNIGAIVFVINKNGDTVCEGNAGTAERVRQLNIGVDSSEIPIVPMEIENYSWTAGLNAPASLLHGTLPKGAGENHFLFNLSFDAGLPGQAFVQISERISSGVPVATVRAEVDDGVVPKGDALSPALDAIRKVVDLTLSSDDAMQGQEIQGDPQRYARNTASVIRLQTLAEFGGYNPATNKLGGMEDHEIYLRMIFKKIHDFDVQFPDDIARETASASRAAGVLVEQIRELLQPVEYVDNAWNKLGDDKKHEKTLREKEAIVAIISLVRSYILNARYFLPQPEQDFPFKR